MLSFEQAISTYLQVERSLQTNRQYGIVLNRLCRDIGPQRDIALIRYEDLLGWLSSRRNAGLKGSTIAGYTNVIKTLFTWCVKLGYIEHSPARQLIRRLPPRDPTRSRAIPAEALASIIEHARYTSPRNHAILLFMADTGCRVGGLLSLTLGNLDLEKGEAWLVEKGSRWHKAYFGERTRAALQHWLKKRPEVEHNFVWTGRAPEHKPLGRISVTYMIARACKAVDVPVYSPHSIRHQVGHAYAKAGIPLTVTQQKLGHSHPSITASFYYPDHSEYVAEISRRNSLIALKSDDDTQPQPPQPRRKILRLVTKSGS